jgi:S1-C subfamily serine protease
VIYELCRIPEKPVYTSAGPKQQVRKYQKSKVTFGIMPAYGDSEKGLKIDGISDPNGVAAKAGIIKGDLIKSINGKPIKDIYEYMDRLGELEPGTNIPVQIERNGIIMELTVAL